MAKLKDKIDNALEEGLILITAAEVVLGFQYRAVFESGFEKLPPLSQNLKVLGLALLLVAIALLTAPAAYHRIVTAGKDSEDLHGFTTQVLGIALLPFGVGLGLDFYVAFEKVMGLSAAVAAGVVTLLFALFWWYGLEFLDKRRGVHTQEKQQMNKQAEPKPSKEDELKDKIKQVLQEARMVIPGAQALLGFQFAVMLAETFDKLPDTSKYVHLASLACIAVSVIFLMTPAAYHRIVEQGEETEHFHNFATRMILAAMVPLALGIAGDFYVVVEKVIKSQSLGIAAAGATLVGFYGLWFGFTLWRRSQHKPALAQASKRQTAK